jgi:hypothetical protein
MIEVRTRQRTWVNISRDDARKWLSGATWVTHYDVIHTSLDRIEILDLAIPAFLDATPNFKKLLFSLDGRDGRPHLQSKLEEISEALRRIPLHIDLWEWPDNRENRESLYELLRACRMPHYGVARMFKMLHLKRPQLIPVIDEWVREAWTENFSPRWTIDDLVEVTFAMREALGSRLDGLNEIRDVAQELGWPYSSLSRLRTYDIIFWAYEYERKARKQ